MKKIGVMDFIESLGVTIPPLEQFWKIGDMTALWLNKNNEFVRLNYHRGPLLYALVSKYKPKRILEFGTAKGYGTLCMAWAMHDNKIDGQIYSIDSISQSELIETPLKRSDGAEHVEAITIKEIWNEVAKPEWFEHIKILTGYSGEVMQNMRMNNFDFAFIDGGHFYQAVKHDFLSFLQNSSDEFGVLFDDYLDKEGWGVKKFIDEEVSQSFDVTLIKTDVENNIKNMNADDYGMCWVTNNSMTVNFVSEHQTINNFLQKYRNFEKRQKLRNRINKKLPILQKIRFRWWAK